MLEPMGTLLIHMSPALVMGALLLVNLATRRQSDVRRGTQDARRMRAALDVELRALLDAYTENLGLIAAGSPFLVSTRSVGAMYRGALGRVLATLDEPALAAVVAAFAHQQRVEAFLSACTRPNGGHGVLVLPRRTPMQEMKRRYADGCREVERALEALRLPQAEPVVAARRLGRARQAVAA